MKHKLHDPDRFSGTRIREKIGAGEEYLHCVPECSREKTKQYEDIIEETQDGPR